MEGFRPCLEIEPSKFMLVVGPRFAATVLSEMVAVEGAKFPALGLAEMVNEGISILLGLKQIQNEAQRAECEKLYRNTFQEDPLPRLLQELQRCGGYDSWLERCFQLHTESFSKNSPPILERLLELQSHGALLMYTGCDDTLSKLTNQQVLLPTEDLSDWLMRRKRGFLNIHGVYWKPKSLQLNCEVYTDPSHPCRLAFGQLEQIFQQRSVIALGTCDHIDLATPMLAAFAKSFLFASAGNVLQDRFHLSLDPVGSSGGLLDQIGSNNGGCVLNLPLFRSHLWRTHDGVGWNVISLREPAKQLCKS